jgi:hypothetical protein
MSKSIWEEVEACVQNGVTGFQIHVTPGELVVPTKRKPGHPRVRNNPVFLYEDYADPRVALNGGRHRPYCARQGCRKSLKKRDILVCSEECAQMHRETLEQALKWLNERDTRARAGQIVPLAKRRNSAA